MNIHTAGEDLRVEQVNDMRGFRFLTVTILTAMSLSTYAGSMSGRVLDLGRKRIGIPGVEITLETYGEKRFEASAYTDGNGHFKIGGVPRAARAKLKAVRRGWLNNPTTRFITTEQESTGDVFMVSEGASAEYYRQVAAEIAATKPSDRSELRDIWFNLPAAEAELVSEAFAALGGDPDDERKLYADDAQTKFKEDRDHAQSYASGTSSNTSSGSSMTSSSSTSTSMTGSGEVTTTRTRMRKD